MGRMVRNNVHAHVTWLNPETSAWLRHSIWGSVCYSPSHHSWRGHSRRNSALICGGQRRIFMRNFTRRSTKIQGTTSHPNRRPCTYSLCCRGGHQHSTQHHCRSNVRRDCWGSVLLHKNKPQRHRWEIWTWETCNTYCFNCYNCILQ